MQTKTVLDTEQQHDRLDKKKMTTITDLIFPASPVHAVTLVACRCKNVQVRASILKVRHRIS